MSVITIAREFASGGIDIGQMIAERLRYDFIDKALIAEVAQAAGVSEETVELIDEIGESPVRSFLRELFTPSNVYSLSPEYPPLIWPYVPTSDVPANRSVLTQNTYLDRSEYLKILQDTIRTLSKRGNVVIVGRGSQCILKDKPNTLHVRFIATMEDRVDYLMNETSATHDACEHALLEKDQQRQHYLHYNYGQNWSDPRLYHLIVNTSTFSWDHVADLIIQSLSKVRTD